MKSGKMQTKKENDISRTNICIKVPGARTNKEEKTLYKFTYLPIPGQSGDRGMLACLRSMSLEAAARPMRELWLV